ncbi:rhomboid family intramembrane serine protease [Marinicellulosiphila megalodicopiae]|uniref:rhomboid family intramembrane serine protease n=1 Tax=Marinicellulosiphila megalodicopiae TaxID=2724896 RepID=UPI003BB1A783
MPANKGELISKFWTVITPSFIHYTLLHLMTNLYLFWLLGAQLEKHSKMQFIAFVMATAVISNCVQWIVVGPNFGGMSGVVYALLGFIWITQYFKSSYYIDNSIAMVLLVLIPIGFTGWIGKLANYAHVSGLISGIIIGLFSLFINQLKKP